MRRVAYRTGGRLAVKRVRNNYAVKHGEVEVPDGWETWRPAVYRELERLVPPRDDETAVLRDEAELLARKVEAYLLQTARRLRRDGLVADPRAAAKMKYHLIHRLDRPRKVREAAAVRETGID